MVTDNILLKSFLYANTLAKKIKVLISIVQKLVSFTIWLVGMVGFGWT